MRSRWECALYVSGSERKKKRKKKRQLGGKKNTTNPKQNADGSCADSPLSALWRALLYFMWVSSPVLIPLSLPSYLSITHSLACSISWLINQPLLQELISPATLLVFHSNDFFWPFPLWDGCYTAAIERGRSRTKDKHSAWSQHVWKMDYFRLFQFFLIYKDLQILTNVAYVGSHTLLSHITAVSRHLQAKIVTGVFASVLSHDHVHYYSDDR